MQFYGGRSPTLLWPHAGGRPTLRGEPLRPEGDVGFGGGAGRHSRDFAKVVRQGSGLKEGGARSHARDLSQQSTRYHSQGVVLQLFIYNKALQVRSSLGLESERAPLQIMFKRNRLVDACGDI